MSFIRQGITRMLRRNRSIRGEIVTLVINGVETPGVWAQSLKCQLRVDMAGQNPRNAPVLLVTDGQDWGIETADYATVLDGEDEPTAVIPAAGDRIIDSQGNTFEVLPMGDKDECYYTRDTGGMQLRVHSKRIKS